jgi:hypothetical protein
VDLFKNKSTAANPIKKHELGKMTKLLESPKAFLTKPFLKKGGGQEKTWVR